jgi:hypothetical protein
MARLTVTNPTGQVVELGPGSGDLETGGFGETVPTPVPS